VALFMLGFILFGLVAYSTLNTLRIKGPYYNQIILGKDLVADILPPPQTSSNRISPLCRWPILAFALA
jgi:methyl-accepting chemotaxis protein